MKPEHTKEYYEKMMPVLFDKYRKKCDFDHEVEIRMPDFGNLPEEYREKAIEVALKSVAKQVATRAETELFEEMALIKRIQKSGLSCLGYTSAIQEVQAFHDIKEGFEFTCYMLSEFKKKYDIN